MDPDPKHWYIPWKIYDFMQVPMLTAREELDIGEKTVAAEIDAYFR